MKQVEEELAEDILEDLLGKRGEKWGEHGGGVPPVACPLSGGTELQSIETICLILPNGAVPGGQPGTPEEATNGIFCAPNSNPYVLTITDVTQGSQKLLRANLDLPTFTQDPSPGSRKLEGEGQLPPIVVQALTGVPAQSGDIAMITGGGHSPTDSGTRMSVPSASYPLRVGSSLASSTVVATLLLNSPRLARSLLSFPR